MSEEKNLVINPNKKSVFRVKLGQAQNFIVAILLIYFLFFGYITNCGLADVQNNPQNYPPDNILYVYTCFYNFTDTFYPWGLQLPGFAQFVYKIPCAVSLLILIFIGAYQAFHEDFVVYGIKNNIWTVPFIILLSWIWTAINSGEFFFAVVGRYFSHYYGYVNIVVLLVVYTAAGLLGSFLKTIAQKREAQMKSRALEVIEEQNEAEAREMEMAQENI